jgi:hypothetical protein
MKPEYYLFAAALGWFAISALLFFFGDCDLLATFSTVATLPARCL